MATNPITHLADSLTRESVRCQQAADILIDALAKTLTAVLVRQIQAKKAMQAERLATAASPGK